MCIADNRNNMIVTVQVIFVFEPQPHSAVIQTSADHVKTLTEIKLQ